MLRRFVALVLGCAALLALPASAHADPVTLSCRAANDDSTTWTLRIDYSKNLIEEIGSSGAAARATTAQISDNSIRWSSDKPTVFVTNDGVRQAGIEHWEGRIDRLSGAGTLILYVMVGSAMHLIADPHLKNRGEDTLSCRQATQKF
jgi:hypothetical protein